MPGIRGFFKSLLSCMNKPGQIPFLMEKNLCGLFIFKKARRGMMEALVGIIMGSKSDWETMKLACNVLDELHIPYEKKVVSAHRTPDLMFEYAETARERGIKVIIAGAGGAAHLPGMVAAKTTLPVIGVPVQTRALNGLDSLLSIVQMPGGVPVATVAIGTAGATNAGLLAAQILGAFDEGIALKLEEKREKTKQTVLESSDELV
jgi:5-(carboxyamino)imidazole ribonucleotide mutase